ncbi:hypothetical protein CAPTEDRAFT_44818, partial [Capitella teleta]
LQDEVDQVIGENRVVQLSDKHKMPYTQACILEILRTASITPSILPNCAVRDSEVGG